MAEPVEAVVEVPEVEPEVKPEVVVPEPKVDDSDVDLTKEPGGDSPEAVYARRRARELRQTKQELDQERTKRIRFEERARILEEQSNNAPKPTETKIFSIAEVNSAVEAGNLNRVDADRYIDEVILPHRIETTLSKREKQIAEKAPVDTAGKYVDDYIKALPALADKSSEDFIRVATKYNELVQMGLPNDFRTQKVALDLTHGDLDARRKRSEIANLNARAPRALVDGGSGGGAPFAGKADFSKAPPEMVKMWEQTATDQSSRERQLKNYLTKAAGAR